MTLENKSNPSANKELLKSPFFHRNKVELIIECSAGTLEESKLNQLCEVKYRLPLLHSYVVEAPKANIGKLKLMDNVKEIHMNQKITSQMINSKKMTNYEGIEDSGYTGDGVGIAILDTGISPIADFTRPENRVAAFKDFTEGKSYPYDNNGHGTHVYGT